MVEEIKDSSLEKTKYSCLEDLPGVRPAIAQKLRELGFHTVESLATAAARELEPVGIGEKMADEYNPGGKVIHLGFFHSSG